VCTDTEIFYPRLPPVAQPPLRRMPGMSWIPKIQSLKLELQSGHMLVLDSWLFFWQMNLPSKQYLKSLARSMSAVASLASRARSESPWVRANAQIL
jgi:hypothetical protein